MKKYLLILMVSLLAMVANASVKIGGINYKLDGYTKTAEVTYGSGTNLNWLEYSGEIVIPSEIKYNYETYNVTSIGDYAFRFCTEITSVTLPNSLISIKEQAFNGCTRLATLSIPNSVTSIGEMAFYNCTNLTSLSIPASVMTIGNSAFLNTGWYNNQYDGLLYLDDWLIGYKGEKPTGLLSVKYGTKFIANGAFKDCNQIYMLTLSSSMTSIGDAAFENCSISRLSFPTGLTIIGNEAFKGCCVSIIEIRSAVPPTISSTSFDDCYKITLLVPVEYASTYNTTPIWNRFIIIPFDFSSPSISFADEKVRILCVNNWDIDGNGDFSEAEAALVKDLGNTFRKSNIVKFDELHYFTGLSEICDSAFFFCENLTSIALPDNVTTIGVRAFSYCKKLPGITLPENVQQIKYCAFENCLSLTRLNIPRYVNDISFKAFYMCSTLFSITVDKENTHYDSRDNCNAIIETASNKLILGISMSTIPQGVVSIGDYAFYNRGMSQINIPNSVEKIGSYAFASCSELTNLIIPNSVTYIGNNAFSVCPKLSNVEISNNVTTLEDSTFYYCDKLTSVTIPSGIKYIYNCVFKNCSSLTSVTFSEGLKSVGMYAFENCSGLTSITFPSSISYISTGAFLGCSNLVSVKMEATEPPTIVNSAFNWANITLYVPAGCKAVYYAQYGTKFKRIVAPDENYIVFSDDIFKDVCLTHWDIDGDGELSTDEAAAVTELGDLFQVNQSIKSMHELQYFTGLTVIEDKTFKGCSSLTGITVPPNVTTIGNNVFEDCRSLTDVTIPYGVTALGNSIFKNCISLENILIPNSVTIVGDYAFEGCSSLTIITLPNNLTKMGNGMFKNCTGLTGITIPNDVTNIGNYAFGSCSSLTDIIIPNNVTSIGRYAFWGCNNLSVTIGNKVVSVGEGAFSCAKSIIVDSDNTIFDSRDHSNAIIETASNTLISGCINTIIPISVTSIGNGAFAGCSSLTTIDIPNSITSIGGSAFYQCSSLTTIDIPNSVTSIGVSAFRECSNLSTISLPSNITIINSYLFTGCSKLDDVIIPSKVTIIGSMAFYKCGKLSNLTIGESVTDIGESAFESCYHLETITFPDNITTIGKYAFRGCLRLKDVVIPKKTNFIGFYAFNGCDNLVSVTVMAINPPKLNGNNTFGDPNHAILYVPVGSKNNYMTSSYSDWRSFDDIVEFVPVVKFADANVKAICVSNWDTDGDGELSEEEAKKVTYLGSVFKNNIDITSFDELSYFTGLTYLNELSFYCCSSLKSITIPKCIKGISSNCVLAGCEALTSLKVDEANLFYDSRDNCNAVIETSTNKLVCGSPVTVIPNTVKTIGYGTFSSLKNLTEITIPNSVLTIEYGAFCYSGLTSVTIPESVSKIEEYAFNDGKNSNAVLTSVTVDIKKPLAIEKNTFSRGTYANATLYVPVGCKAAYEAAAYWQDFKEIKEIGAPDLIPLTVGVKDVTVLQGSFVEDKDAMHFDFEDDETMWSWGNSPETGIAEGSYNGSKYQATTNPSKRECWETQIAMDFNQLVPEEEYVLHFWAKSDKSFGMNAMLQYPSDEAGYPSRGEFGWIDVGTEWQEYTLTTKITGPNATRLILNIGELDNGTFCLDDISLRRKNPLFELTYDGFADGDDETTAFTTLPVATTTATNDSPVGTYPITISGGVSEKYSITYQPGTLTIVAPVLGDANGDGKVTITDAVAIVNQILGNPSNDFDASNADVNHDGSVTITDAVGVVNIILNNGGESAPFM